MLAFSKISLEDHHVDFLQGVWSISNEENGLQKVELIPDGYPELIIPLQGSIRSTINGRDFQINEPSLIGQLSLPASLVLSSKAKFVSFKLYPWMLGVFSKGQAKEMRNAIVPLACFSSQLNQFSLEFQEQLLNVVENDIALFHYLEKLDSFVSSRSFPVLQNDLFSKFDSIRTLQQNEAKVKIKFSRRYLEKLYSENVGLSPLQYYKVLRVKKASLLFNTKNYKLSEIADALGYHDYSHLYKDFKQVTAINPKKYMLQNNPLNHFKAYTQQWDYS